jgi:hypothetical protein
MSFYIRRSPQTNRKEKTNTIASRPVNVSHDPKHERNAREISFFFFLLTK